MKTLIDTKSMNSYDSFALVIKSVWVILFRGFGKISLLVVVSVLSTNFAMADPPRTSCDDGGVGGCVDVMLDQQVDMIDGVEEIVDEMEAVGLFAFFRAKTGDDMQSGFKERIANLRNEHSRAREVNAVTTDVEYDAMLAQGDNETGKNCKNSDMNFYNSLKDELSDPNDPVEPPGLTDVGPKFGNGKCDIFDASDEYGDSVRVNERKENMCAQVCTDKKDSNGNSRTGQSKGRFLGSMDDAVSSGRKATQMLFAQKAKISQLGVSLRQLQISGVGSLNDDDVCAIPSGDESSHLQAERAMQIVITALDAVTAIGDVLVEVLETIKDIADNPCGQDVLGNNAQTACTGLTVVFHVAKGINDIVKNVSTLTGDAKDLVANDAEIAELTKTDNGIACSKEIRDEFVGPDGKVVKLQVDVAELKGKMGTLQDSADASSAALAELKEKMIDLQLSIEYNQKLLLTPTGARNDFNNK